jgi:hypothetical protein
MGNRNCGLQHVLHTGGGLDSHGVVARRVKWCAPVGWTSARPLLHRELEMVLSPRATWSIAGQAISTSIFSSFSSRAVAAACKSSRARISAFSNLSDDQAGRIQVIPTVPTLLVTADAVGILTRQGDFWCRSWLEARHFVISLALEFFRRRLFAFQGSSSNPVQ